MANHTDQSHRAAPVEPAGRQGLTWRSQQTIGVSLAAVGALLVLAAGVLLLLHHGGVKTPDLATGQPTGSAGPSGSAEPSGSAGPSKAAGGPTVNFRYDGGRAQSDLDEATVVLPTFGGDICPSGPTKFHSGHWAYPDANPLGLGATLAAVVVADVTGDSTPEHLVLVTCKSGSDIGGYNAVVIAVAGVASNGTFNLVGQVISGKFEVSTGVLTELSDPQVAADHSVRVLVHTINENGDDTGRQWHAFKWGGTAFASAGNTPAPVQTAPTQLSVKLAATTLKLQGAASAGPHGQFSYTITNHGGGSSTSLRVTLDSSLPLAVSVPGALGPLARSDAVSTDRSWLFTIDPVPAGQTVTGTMVLTLDPAAVNSSARSAPFRLTVNGFDYDYFQTNVSTANKATLTVTH